MANGRRRGGALVSGSAKRPVTMVERAREYLTYRRSLGFKLESAECVLLDFAVFADTVQPGQCLTRDVVLRWATRDQRHSSKYRVARLSIVRGFARFLVALEGVGEVPDMRVLPGGFRRRQPHIYTDRQLCELVDAATRLHPTYPLRPHVYKTLFGLLASTGLRISEALALRRGDVNLEQGVLRIRETKFRKSRLVPIDGTVARELRRFADCRDQEPDCSVSDMFLVGRRGQPLPYSTVRTAFRRLATKLGWKSNGTLPLPRIHDLRHSFACRRILLWYREGIDIDRALASLSTYMGHGKLTDTYWYLTSSGAVFDIARDRFERFASRGGAQT
jgi:integrase